MENTTTNTTAQNTNVNKYNPQEYVDLADKTYLGFIKDGKYKDIISSMATLGDYSLRNQMLILQQKPDATKVNNMTGWNYQKRNIQKGSQSIKILAPIFDTVLKTENGKIVEKKSDFVSGYKINFVFDVSQTEAKTLEEMRSESENLEPYYDVISKALKETLKSYEFKTGEIESDGILNTRTKTITLNSGMDEKTTLKTLVEQVAAALVLGRDRDNFKGLRSEALPNINALEISAVAEIVSKRLGIEGNNAITPEFEKMNDETIQKFQNNIGVMRSISQRMIMAIDNALDAAKTQEKLADLEAENATAQGESIPEPSLPEPVVEAEPQTKTRNTIKTTTKTRVKAEAEMGS